MFALLQHPAVCVCVCVCVFQEGLKLCGPEQVVT